MKAIILAAGMGQRIQGYTLGEPKSLIKINQVPILYYSLSYLSQLGIQSIDIVVGYKKESIESALYNTSFTKNISFIENKEYVTTGTAFSLFKGLEKNQGEDIVLLEADVLFQKELLECLILSNEKNATLVEKFYPGLDGSFIELDAQNYVRDWTHKNMRSENALIEHLFKTINLHKFSGNFINNILIPKLRSLYSHISKANVSLEYIFRDLVKKDSRSIKGIDNRSRFLWQEIDDIEDLKLAQQKFAFLSTENMKITP